MFFKTARKTQNLHILRGNMNQNVIFCVQTFFKIVLFKNNFFFQIVLLKKKIFFKIVLINFFFFKIMLFKQIFWFKIWRVVKILIKNLTRCKNFNSKSDAL